MFEGLYAIIDAPHPHALSLADQTAAVIADGKGASIVQLRAKTATTDQRIAMLETMAPICLAAEVPLIVNDDVEAALRGPAGVSGLHLGQDDDAFGDIAALRARAQDRERFLVGLSTHNPAQLKEACDRQPDYVALGPISATTSKANPDPVVGFETLLECCRRSARPLVAIGGLDAELGARSVELGASGVAIISALVHETPAATRDASVALARSFLKAAQPLPFERVVELVPVLPAEQLAELARWGDDLAVHMGLGLPARFSPSMRDGVPQYKPRDLLDLLYVLDKHPRETWDAWKRRAAGGEVDGPLVQLRRD